MEDNTLVYSFNNNNNSSGELIIIVERNDTPIMTGYQIFHNYVNRQ
jgi:hypothetical protein